MIRNLLKAALVLFLLVTWMVTSPTSAAAGEKEFYAAAKKEGKINWAGTLDFPVASAVNKVFMKKYPGIQVTYTKKGTAPMVQTIEAELMAKKITYDIVNITDPQTLSRWKKQKVLVPYKPKGWDLLPPVVKDRDGYFTDVGVTANVFAYNSKFVSAGDAPTDWLDFLDPKWKGKIVSAVPRGYGAQYYFYATLTELFGWKYIEGLAKQDILFVRGASRALRMVNSGERVLTPGIPLDRTLNLKRKGNPIGISVPTDFIGLNPRAAGILKDAPHPNGARLLMGYLLTKEAQQIFAEKGSLYPVLSDVSLPADMAAIPLSKLTPLHRDKFTEEHDSILNRLEETLKIRR